jgi:ankyrin repeat protein
MHAAMKGKVEVMELLLSKGANIEAADKVIILK